MNSNKRSGKKSSSNRVEETKEVDGDGQLIEVMETQYKDNEEKAVSLSQRKLYDLAFVEMVQGQHLSSIMVIDVTKNFISNIDVFNKMHNLRKITASDNYISQVNLTLSKLTELGLKNNFLLKVPALQNLPQLKVLDLNTNKLTNLRISFKDGNLNAIEKLDFGNNKIDFKKKSLVTDFTDKLKRFKKLKVLNMDHNPWEANPVYKAMFTRNLPQQLEIFNNQRSGFWKDTMLDEDDVGPKMLSQKSSSQKIDHESLTPGTQTPHDGANRKRNSLPSFQQLCYSLEAANCQPAKALDFLKTLFIYADSLTNEKSAAKVDMLFTMGKDQNQVQEMIETFMQNAQLLVDNHFELRQIMLSILSKLTTIKAYDFGLKCFNTLRDLMMAGKELESLVMNILQKEVLRKLDQRDPENIPVSLLIGLKDLVVTSKHSGMLRTLYDSCFPCWLKELQKLISKQKTLKTSLEDDRPHYDAIMELLAASLADNKGNCKLLVAKGLDVILADILQNSHAEHSRYIPLLESVTQIATHSKKAASTFITKNVNNHLTKLIKNTYYSYKKHNSLVDVGGMVTENAQSNKKSIIRKYKVFACQIECLGSLLNTSNPNERVNLLTHKITNELLVIVSHYKTDPILLTAVCKLAYNVLSSAEIKHDAEKLQKVCESMQSCINLIPYLGLTKYDELLQMTRKYHSALAYDDGNQKQLHNNHNLSYQDDPIIHNLFIAIIQLINFFCIELEKLKDSRQNTKLFKVFEMICNQMNDKDREHGLFMCLQVPNDDVRLAVVDCLFNVAIQEIEPEEMASLVKILDHQNVGAGKTEYVLSTVFWILTKVIRSKDVGNSETNTIAVFRQKYCRQAVDSGLDILYRDISRICEDAEEEKEKYTLALTIVNFLKFVCVDAKTSHMLLGKGDFLKKLLFAEQTYVHNASVKDQELFEQIPLEIEDSNLGNFKFLTNAIHGHDSVSPYNYVSFRVLHQIANVLQNKQKINLFDRYGAGVDIEQELFDFYRSSLQNKIAAERACFEEYPEGLIEELKTNHQMHKYNEFKGEHDLFTGKSGIQLILSFLMKKSNSDDYWFKQHADPDIEKIEQQGKNKKKGHAEDPIKKFKKKLRIMEDEHCCRNEEGNNITDTRFEQMKSQFMVEELGGGYEDASFRSNQNQVQQKILTNQRQLGTRGVENHQLRSLCIAAFLRCLWASIVYAPTHELQKTAINNLKSDKLFVEITQLCTSTGWFENNIGTKYLMIMRYVLRMEPEQAWEEESRLAKYQIMSLVMKTILHGLSDKIDVLQDDEKILISELSMVIHDMAFQLSLFPWNVTNTLPTVMSYTNCKGEEVPATEHLILVDYHMSLLFPISFVQVLIDAIFKDMQQANQVYDQKDGEQRAHEKDTAYIQTCGTRAREHIKLFLGEYLGFCHTNKYKVLEYIMTQMVFENQKMRTSFLDEVLKQGTFAQMRLAYNYYLKSYPGSIASSLKGKKTSDGYNQESIKASILVEICFDGEADYKSCMMLFTNLGVYLVRMPPTGLNACKVCPAKALCPDGPEIIDHFAYQQIKCIHEFLQVAQKFHFQIARHGSRSFSMICCRLQGVYQLNQALYDFVYPHRPDIRIMERLQFYSIKYAAGLKDDEEAEEHKNEQYKNDDYSSQEQIKFCCYISKLNSLQDVKGINKDEQFVRAKETPQGWLGPKSSKPEGIPQLRLLILTNKKVVLLKENVQYWIQTTQADDKTIEKKYKYLEQHGGQLPGGHFSTPGETPTPGGGSSNDKKGIAECIKNMMTKEWGCNIMDLTDLKSGNGRIPSMQLKVDKERTNRRTEDLSIAFIGDLMREDTIKYLTHLFNTLEQTD